MNCKLHGTFRISNISHVEKNFRLYWRPFWLGDTLFAREVQNHLYIFQPSSSQKSRIFLYTFIYTRLWIPDLYNTFKLKVITNHESSQDKEKKLIYVSNNKIIIELVSRLNSDEVIFYRIRMRTGQAWMHAWGFILQYYTWLMRMHACMG